MFYQYRYLFRVLIILANLLIFFTIILNTVISVWQLIIIAGIYALFSVFIYRWIRPNWEILFEKSDYFGFLVPLIFHLFFFLNFVFSHHPQTETYGFSNTSSGRIGTTSDNVPVHGNSTTILLENNAYGDFYFIRTFVDYEKMRGKNVIEYTFEEGLLGLKVIKNYRFSNDNVIFE